MPAVLGSKLLLKVSFAHPVLCRPNSSTLSPTLRRGEGRSVLKRPASLKTKAWKNGKTCPRCERGKLHGWVCKAGDACPKVRCNAKHCQVYLNPHHLHPVFSEGYGVAALSLKTQAAMLLLKLNNLYNNLANSTIHRLLHVNHKAIEDIGRRLCVLRKDYVEQKEKEIQFGDGASLKDIEADETTFDKKDVSALVTLDDAAKPIEWEQWLGVVQRGKPETLVLHRLKPPRTVQRAPGPGAVRKVEWRPFAQRWLQDKKVILHTDSAKSYRLRLPGVLHDRVVHCKKRVKVRGVWKWLVPRYTKIVTHKVPNSKKTLRVKSGTQIIDRCWRFLKDRVTLNQNAKVGSHMLRCKLRSAQYQYWLKNQDLCLQLETCASGHSTSAFLLDPVRLGWKKMCPAAGVLPMFAYSLLIILTHLLK